jgi:hypothetical protein
LAAVCLVLGLAVGVTLPGCSGCRKSAAQRKKEEDERKKKEEEKKKKEKEEEERKKKEKPKPDFEVTLETRPASDGVAFGADLVRRLYKPGHWTATTFAARANNFDFVGNLETTPSGRDRDLPVVSEFSLTASRQVSLPKGQPKLFESVVYVPPAEASTNLSCKLTSQRGHALFGFLDGLLKMPSYQYHFVVLARWPAAYAYLQGLDSIRAPIDELQRVESADPYYRISLIQGDKRAPLPSHALLWSSIAYVLWDDADPDSLDPNQQAALVDWLHWGGQLILSGPATLDTLKGSFLGPYLPAAAVPGGRNIGPEDFEEFARWSKRGKQESHPPLAPLRLARPWSGVTLVPHPEARFIPGCGDLIVERPVGSGRVVATAFPLGNSGLSVIPGGDELLNAFLLRRHARRFRVSPVAQPEDFGGTGFVPGGPRPAVQPVAAPKPAPKPAAKRDEDDGPVMGDEIEVRWADGHGRNDAAYVSQLRYFSRDTEPSGYGDKAPNDMEYANPYGSVANASLAVPAAGPGLAAWNDTNKVAVRARDALTEASAIEIPRSEFVLWVIGSYLLVLVPANWLVFRTINRVEWAWAAAPVIAVVSTGVVIRLAQLDIGFARCRTEIAVVETQANYPRAHVTRYTALYTSLTTRYDFELDDPGAGVLPMAKDARPSDKAVRQLMLRRGEHVRLEGVPVRSNTVDLIHSEQMLDLGGSFALEDVPDGGLRVTNGSQFTVSEAGVIRRHVAEDLVDVAWLGTLEPGESKPVAWSRTGTVAELRSGPLEDYRAGAPLTGRRSILGGGTLRPNELNLVALAECPSYLRPGETRLVGAIDEEAPGIQIRPAAPQTRCAGLVVAHLRCDHLPEPEPDVNSMVLPSKGRN